MGTLFDTILTTSLQASIVGLFILLFKQLLKDRISPKWHYIIWIVLIIKLMVPFGPESPFSIFNRMPDRFYTLDSGTVAAVIDSVAAHGAGSAPAMVVNDEKSNASTISTNINAVIATDTSNPMPNAPDSKHIISEIWLAGTVLFLLWLVYTNLTLIMKLYQNKSDDDDDDDTKRFHLLLDQCKDVMSIHRNIPIVVQNMIHTPCLFGCIHPRILLPHDITKLDDKSVSYILMHELAHYKRKDIPVNYMLLLLQAMHWFNPVMWLCFRQMRHDMEMATDQKVLEMLENKEHKEYGRALLLALESFTSSAVTPKLICMADDKKNTEKRIKMIRLASIFNSRRKQMMTTGLLCLVFLGGILLTSGVAHGTSSFANGTDKTLENLIKYKTAYIGNNSKVAALTMNLQLSEYRGTIALKTKAKPYGLLVNYRLVDHTGAEKISWNKNDVYRSLRYNAVMLFCLIDNVDTITFHVQGNIDMNVSFTRSDLQTGFVKDVRKYSKDTTSLRLLSDSIGFTIYAAPSKYTPLMSSTPGIQLSHENTNTKYTKYTTQTGSLLTWDKNTGKIRSFNHSAKLETTQPIYWSVLQDGSPNSKSTYVDIEIYGSDGKPVIEKRIEIVKDKNMFYSVRQRSDVVVSDQKSITQNAGSTTFKIDNLSSVSEQKPFKRISLGEAEKLINASPMKEITYDSFFEQMGIQVYKSKDKNGLIRSYMIKDGKVVSFGSLAGDFNSKDICVSDLDHDGKPELIYSVIFGSGLNITKFQCLSAGRMLDVRFGSDKFVNFTFIKKDMQNVELAFWYPDIAESAKHPIPLGKLFINGSKLGLKLYDNLDKNLLKYVTTQ